MMPQEQSVSRLEKDNENLQREIGHLREHIALLARLSRRIASSLDPSTVLQEVVDGACELTNAQYGALVVFDASGQLQQLIPHGLTPQERDRIGGPPRGLGFLGALRELRRPLRLADLSQHPRFVGFPPGHPPMKTFLGVPIRDGDEAVGNLYLTEKAGGAEFTIEDEELLLLFAGHAAAAIRNARLFERERTARSEAEATQRALAELEARHQAILDNTTAVIFVKDLEGRYLLVNRRFEALRGVQREEIVGKTAHDFLPKETADALRDHDLKVIEAQAPLEWEEQVPRADGVRTYISLRFPLWDSGGLLYGVCGILTDITERKRAETELRAEYQGLRWLVDTSPAGVLVVEASTGRVLLTNREFQRLRGFAHDPEHNWEWYESAYVRRRADGRVYDPEETPLARALNHGETVRAEEMWLEFPEGRRVRILASATPVYSEDGQIVAAVAVSQDITPMEDVAPLREQAEAEKSPNTMTHPWGPGTDVTLEFAFATERGVEREVNEDSVYCEPVAAPRAQGKGWLCAVADGMGGHAMGEVASSLAARALADAYYSSLGGSEALRQAAVQANDVVYRASLDNPSYRGMGTTLTAAVIMDRKIAVAHVGDSRAYLVHRGGIRQLTRDHTLVAELVRAGALTPEQARNNPYRNTLTRALGRQPTVEVDAGEEELEQGDILVLCSDGLFGSVGEQDIADVVSAQPAQRAASLLVSLAKQRGGTDDVSVIVIACGR